MSSAPVIKREMGGQRGGGRSGAQEGVGGRERSAGPPGPGKKQEEKGRAWEEQQMYFCFNVCILARLGNNL
jgi:hypothetical protein